MVEFVPFREELGLEGCDTWPMIDDVAGDLVGLYHHLALEDIVAPSHEEHP